MKAPDTPNRAQGRSLNLAAAHPLRNSLSTEVPTVLRIESKVPRIYCFPGFVSPRRGHIFAAHTCTTSKYMNFKVLKVHKVLKVLKVLKVHVLQSTCTSKYMYFESTSLRSTRYFELLPT